jgi:hypothetical protein
VIADPAESRIVHDVAAAVVVPLVVLMELIGTWWIFE